MEETAQDAGVDTLNRGVCAVRVFVCACRPRRCCGRRSGCGASRRSCASSSRRSRTSPSSIASMTLLPASSPSGPSAQGPGCTCVSSVKLGLVILLCTCAAPRRDCRHVLLPPRPTVSLRFPRSVLFRVNVCSPFCAVAPALRLSDLSVTRRLAPLRFSNCSPSRHHHARACVPAALLRLAMHWHSKGPRRDRVTLG
eukprot:1176767-Rhodomonas_salina.1